MFIGYIKNEKKRKIRGSAQTSVNLYTAVEDEMECPMGLSGPEFHPHVA